MLNDLIPIILFYFLYSCTMTIIKNTNRKNTMKMLIDNNLINSGENNISFKFFSSEENTPKTNYVLPVALGLMGLSFGLIVGAFIVADISSQNFASNKQTWFDIKDAIQLGAPLFFASIGVVVAYFIEKKKQ